ncbi:MAG: CGNR zinc finger domain-containing protein [Tepidiformaceae bacterium]
MRHQSLPFTGDTQHRPGYTSAEGIHTDAELELLLGFLRTRTVPDELATTARFAAWLGKHGLVPEGETVEGATLKRAVHLRSALIGLLREQAGQPPDPRTRPAIEAVTKAAPLQVVVDEDRGLQLVPAGMGVDRALAKVVAAAYILAERGSLERLKVCQGCGWAFFDSTKNHSRIWCDMATCGSQHKARAYRQRQATARGR